MAVDELEVVRLRNDFYRDGLGQVWLAAVMIFSAVVLLCVVSLYLHAQKPSPVTFVADSEWRVLQPVPKDQPYVSNADLIQWVSDVVPKSFTFDFVNYSTELDALKQYYTSSGWGRVLDAINVEANNNTVSSARLFVDATPAGAPIISNQGLLPDGSYGWWIQMPLLIHYTSADKHYDENNIVIKALVVRVSTHDNLSGILIDNFLVSKGEGGAVSNNG